MVMNLLVAIFYVFKFYESKQAGVRKRREAIVINVCETLNYITVYL